MSALSQIAGNAWVTAGSLLAALLTIVFTALANRRKSEIDESTLVLGKWKELVEAHESRLKRMNEDFEAYRINSREEREALKARVAELEHKVKSLEDGHAAAIRDRDEQIRARDEEIAGLKAAIRANSRSTAVLLTDHRPVEEQAPTTSEQVRPKPGSKRDGESK